MKQYEKFIQAHEEVKQWLSNRPENTRRLFAIHLERFCTAICIDPKDWRDLDKHKARDLAWQYISTLTAENSSVAHIVSASLRSFYRNKDGESLPFDSTKGGKHYFHVTLKKAALEHIPNKQEVYQIIDAASSLRDMAILQFLFKTGVRVNVIEHLRYKDIAKELDKETLMLKVSPELDFKLRGRDIPYYWTAMNGEGTETLKRYVELAHKQKRPETPLFYTSSKSPITQEYIWRIFKNCVKKAGLDSQTMWPHSLRKAFRKIVRQAEIDDDDKEQLMGHRLRGSRQSYFDSKDTELIQKAYQKCNFTREVPKSELSKMREQLEDEQSKRALNEAEVTGLKAELRELREQVQQLIEKKA